MKTAFIYVRTNTEDPADAEHQARRCGDHCIQRGYRLVDNFSRYDMASGLATDAQCQWETLQNQAVSLGEDAVVVVYNAERISRNALTLEQRVTALYRAGVVIETVSPPARLVPRLEPDAPLMPLVLTVPLS